MKPINGPINVSETEFQELFKLYWDTLEGSNERHQIIEELNTYVYFYIFNRCSGDYDLASDFFIHTMSKMKKIIEDYEPSYRITFLVYLTSKIKRSFLNFRIKAQKLKAYENINDYYEINPDDHVESVFEPKNHYSEGSDLFMNLHSCLSHLKMDEEVAIKLYFCFPLLSRDFRHLTRKLPRKTVFSKYRNYLIYIDRKLQVEKESREKIIKRLHFTNINIREEYDYSLLKRRQRLTSNFYKLKNPVPLRLIAELMDTNVTNIHRKIKRARVKLYSLLKDQMYFQFQPIDDLNETIEYEKAA